MQDEAMGMTDLMREVPSAALLAASACGTAMAVPPPEIADQLQAIGPVIEITKTAQIYSALLPKDLYAGTEAARDLVYGADQKQQLDVFTLAGGKVGAKPVLVFVHGGGFVGGDKHSGASPLYDNVMVWAARHGMVGVNINYRLAPANKWPAGAEDVGLAIDWIGGNIGKFGGDPRRIFLWGHSVGATHVADYLAHRRGLVKKSRPGVTGAILSSGQIYDMTGPNVSKAYFGDEETRYPAMASLPGLVKSGTPLMITVAELDPPAFRNQTDTLKAALNKAGRRPTSIELAGHSHISEIYAIGTSDTGLSDAVRDFVTSGSTPP
jgi:acetyl esterase/lipase